MTDANGNGFSNKELILKVWDEVREHRADTKAAFKEVETRLDSLEQTRAEGTTGRKVRDIVIQVIATVLVGSLLALVLAPQVAK